MNFFLILFGKLLSKFFRILNLGNGSTWPGHIALRINKNFIRDLITHHNLQVVVVAGTNGKTTTSLMIKTILEKNGKKVLHNASGANLLNGVASALLLATTRFGKIDADYGIFEIDENILPLLLNQITPQYLLLLNLFRDQLDRYGEVRIIANKWKKALSDIQTTLIVNADDPLIAWLADSTKTHKFFGLSEKGSEEKKQQAADSLYCPQCGERLIYETRYFSHLGKWHCPHCKRKRPELSYSQAPFYPLSGTYNKYNTLAASLLCKTIGLTHDQIQKGLEHVQPAFGRQEVIEIDGRKIQIFLSKNPTGFNESIRTIQEKKAENVMLILNDRIADGKDVSWIWDIDTESLVHFTKQLTISGDRCFDMGLRIKYSYNQYERGNTKYQIQPHLKIAIQHALENIPHTATLYILPTYTAMLDVRKILGGKKIL